MNNYVFKYKRRFFWKKIICNGHNYEAEADKMTLYLEGGGLISIPKWRDCHLRLGNDFILYTKKQMELDSGQKVELKREGL